jgi:hypothetical protein
MVRRLSEFGDLYTIFGFEGQSHVVMSLDFSPLMEGITGTPVLGCFWEPGALLLQYVANSICAQRIADEGSMTL